MSARLATVKASCSACIILITTGRCIGVCRCRTSDFFAVQIKFHNRSITVNYNLCLAAVIEHDLIFIPYRENMKGIFVVIPLALIQIIGIFWDTCRVNETESNTADIGRVFNHVARSAVNVAHDSLVLVQQYIEKR